MLFLRRSQGTIRDRLWLWGHHPGSHDSYDLPERSRMTPAEGALYLTIPNVIMVKYGPQPAPPYDQLALSFRSLDRVVWSLVGAGGHTDAAERDEVLSLASRHANIGGVILDDFWSGGMESNKGVVLSVPEVAAIHEQVKDRNLDMWAVLYTSELHRWKLVEPYIRYFDHLTLWCWKPEELSDMNHYLKTLKDRVPDRKIYMGCYLYDFGRKRPMPEGKVEQMTREGFAGIRNGFIEGMVFIGSPVLDVGLAAVEYLRDWILRAGDKPARSS